MRTATTAAETGNEIERLAGLRARDQEALAAKDLLVGTKSLRHVGLTRSVRIANQNLKILAQICLSVESPPE
jgi:hypothetical protein